MVHDTLFFRKLYHESPWRNVNFSEPPGEERIPAQGPVDLSCVHKQAANWTKMFDLVKAADAPKLTVGSYGYG